jgi:hypothetical protein
MEVVSLVAEGVRDKGIRKCAPILLRHMFSVTSGSEFDSTSNC